MLNIDQQQVLQLLNSQRDAFAAEYSGALKEEFPELCAWLTDEQIKDMLKDECERVKKYSVVSAYGIYTIFSLRVGLDWNFPEGEDNAWAREILARDSIPEEDRISALESVVWGTEDE